MLASHLRMLRGSSHGFIHCAGGLFAEFALALVAALQILKVVLENFRASRAQSFSRRLVHGGFGLLLRRAIGMLPEPHNGSISAPIVLTLPFPLSLHLLVQRINQEIVSPQNEYDPYGPQNHEPLKHAMETPSPNFILAGFSLAQAARQRHDAHEYLHCVRAAAAQARRWAARADNCLTVYWTFCQFPAAVAGCKLKLSQSKVRP